MRALILCVCIVLVSCESSKKVITANEIANFKHIVENKQIEVNADFAQAFALNMGVSGLQNLLPPGDSVGNINLIDNPNFFIIKKDTLKIDLPYYGQQQMAAGYNANIGIEFSGKVKSLRKEYKPKKNSYVLRYVIDAENENYTIFLTLYPNNTSNMVVNSSRRTSITYIGKWKVLQEEKI